MLYRHRKELSGQQHTSSSHQTATTKAGEGVASSSSFSGGGGDGGGNEKFKQLLRDRNPNLATLRFLFKVLVVVGVACQFY
jgi:hypothetical protein